MHWFPNSLRREPPHHHHPPTATRRVDFQGLRRAAPRPTQVQGPRRGLVLGFLGGAALVLAGLGYIATHSGSPPPVQVDPPEDVPPTPSDPNDLGDLGDPHDLGDPNDPSDPPQQVDPPDPPPPDGPEDRPDPVAKIDAMLAAEPGEILVAISELREIAGDGGPTGARAGHTP